MQQSTLEPIQSDESPKSIDELRRDRLALDDHQCCNCGDTDDLQVHHVVPKSRGGVDELSNLRTLCSGCHSKVHGGQIGYIKNNNQEHGNPEKTRWLPSVQTMQYFVSNVHHPLRKSVIMLMAKTGLGLSEMVSLKKGDLYFRGGGVWGASTVEPPKRPFVLMPANENRPGLSKRLADTYIPLDRETLDCLKGWLAIRPDSAKDNLFVYTTGDWGEPLTPRALRGQIRDEARRLDIFETPDGENLNPVALTQFFRNRFNGQPAVRAYIDGKKKEMPMPLGQLITDYRENVYKLDTGNSWL